MAGKACVGKVLNIPTGPGQVEQVRRRLGNMHEGICEGLGVVDEGTQQQPAVQHPQNKG